MEDYILGDAFGAVVRAEVEKELNRRGLAGTKKQKKNEEDLYDLWLNKEAIFGTGSYHDDISIAYSLHEEAYHKLEQQNEDLKKRIERLEKFVETELRKPIPDENENLGMKDEDSDLSERDDSAPLNDVNASADDYLELENPQMASCDDEEESTKNNEEADTTKNCWSISCKRSTEGGTEFTSTTFLPEDIYTMMMCANPCSKKDWTGLHVWILGVLTFLLQVGLSIAILLDLALGDPYPLESQGGLIGIGQGAVILLCVLFQQDLIDAVRILSLLVVTSEWKELIGFSSEIDQSTVDVGRFDGVKIPFLTCLYYEEDLTDEEKRKREFVRSMWRDRRAFFFRVFVPNLLKMLQSVIVLFLIFIVVIYTDNLLDLVKDFTALFIISEIDEKIFELVDDSYFGPRLQKEALSSKEKTIPVDKNNRYGYRLRSALVLFFICTSFVIWGCFVYTQNIGGLWKSAYLNWKYPDCKEHMKELSIFNFTSIDFTDFDKNFSNAFGMAFSNGHCDTDFNVKVCGYDGNDCSVDHYPLCQVLDSDRIGDGEFFLWSDSSIHDSLRIFTNCLLFHRFLRWWRVQYGRLCMGWRRLHIL